MALLDLTVLDTTPFPLSFGSTTEHLCIYLLPFLVPVWITRQLHIHIHIHIYI